MNSHIKKLMFAPLIAAAFAHLAFASWELIPAGPWQTMLHLGADYNADMIPSNNDLGTDHLLNYTGVSEMNQFPAAGDVVSLPHYKNLPEVNVQTNPDTVAREDFVWTVVTNPASLSAPAANWTPPAFDHYIKYLHAYLFVDSDVNQNVRFYACSDDDLRVWVNGSQKFSQGYTGGMTVRTATLSPGIQSVTIKFRESTGGQFFGIYMTDSEGAALTNVYYSLNAFISNVPAPEVVSLTEQSALLASAFENTTGDALNFYAACADGDYGDNLEDWIAAGAVVQTNENVVAAPATVLFQSLAPNTEYAARYFVATEFQNLASPALRFTSYDERPVVVAKDAANLEGLAADAVGELVFTGSESARANVTLYWGATAVGDAGDPETWGGAPVTRNNLELGEIVIPLSDLWYSTEYRYCFKAVNNEGESWSDTIVFSTLGEPIFGALSAEIVPPKSLELSAEIIESGPVPATVELHFAPAGEPLVFQQTWSGVGNATNISHTIGGLQVGGVYDYAFSMHCAIDENTSWTIWSATNTVTLSGVTTWTSGGGANTDWNLDANWDNGVPGPGARANFHVSRATATAAADLSVEDALFNTIGAFTLNLNGRSLNVGKRVDIGGNAISGQTASHWAALNLVNGNIDMPDGIFSIGANSHSNTLVLSGASMLRAKELLIGNGGYNDHSVTVSGPATIRTETLKVGAAGKSNRNHMLIENTVITNSGDFVIGSGEASGTRLILDNAGIVNGKTISPGAGWHGDGHSMHILNGSVVDTVNFRSGDDEARDTVVVISNSTLKVADTFFLSGGNGGSHRHRMYIGQDPGRKALVSAAKDFIVDNAGAQDGRVILNDGAIEVAATFRMANHASLIVTNGLVTARTLEVRGGDACVYGLRIVGERALVNVTDKAVFGTIGTNNLFVVDSGAFNITNALEIGSGSACTNTFLVTGATAKVAAGTLVVRKDATLAFSLPASGFDNGVNGKTVMEIRGAAALDAASKVKISTGRFTGRARLLQAASITQLPDANFEVDIPRGYSCKLIREPDYIEIFCSINGTMLIVR